MDFEEEKELEHTYVMNTFARKDVEFVRGNGMVLTDSQGKEYLDFLAGIGVVSLGHCHAALVDAITAQASRLVHVSNYYYIEQRGELAQTISEMLNENAPDDTTETWKSFFANSGAEANECAIKLARLFARRRADEDRIPALQRPRLIVTIEGSFHGRTLATLAATSQPTKQEAFLPLPDGFISVPRNDIAALKQLFVRHGDDICAVMVECIQGESGVHPLTEEFLRCIRQLTDEQGSLLICDEVQSGCYRTGRACAYQYFGIVPDIVTMAKGVASGIPMGVCAARAEVADAFEPGDHGSTFGGSNIAIAAASATLSILRQDGFADHVSEVGRYFRDRLMQVDGIVGVRGLGLMVGADVAPIGPTAPEVVDAAQQARLIINATGSETLRFLPPLICEKNHIDTLVDELSRIIGSASDATSIESA